MSKNERLVVIAILIVLFNQLLVAVVADLIDYSYSALRHPHVENVRDKPAATSYEVIRLQL